MSSSAKIGISAAVLAIAATGGYWYFSPYISLNNMRSAATAKDADAFNDHVDYPKLRESLKGQMAAIVGQKIGSGSQSGAESFGAALGMALLGPMVDAFVRPELVMRSMQEGDFQPRLGGDQAKSSDGTSGKEVKWNIERKGMSKVIAYGQDADSSEARPGFVFERSGFADWKLTEIRLPASK